MAPSLSRALLSLLHRQSGEQWALRTQQRLIAPSPRYADPALEQYHQQETATGALNMQILPIVEYVWPYWVQQQSQDEQKQLTSFSSLGCNRHHRKWTGVSYPGCNAIAIVDPRGLITPSRGGWSLDSWISIEKTSYFPSQLPDVSQQFTLDNPAVVTTYAAEGVQVESTVFMKPLTVSTGTLYVTSQLTNTTNKDISLSFFYGMRPFNPEGVAPIHDIVYVSQQAFVVDHRLGLCLDQAPDNVICLPFSDGDTALQTAKWEQILQAQCPSHMASGVAEYRLTLKPGEKTLLSCRLPCGEQSPLRALSQSKVSPLRMQQLRDDIRTLKADDISKEREAVAKSYQSIHKHTMTVDLPDVAVTQCFNQAVHHVLQFIGANTFMAGAFSYNHPSVYRFLSCVRALNRSGHSDRVVSLLSPGSEMYTAIQHALRSPSRHHDVCCLWVLAVQDTYHFTRRKAFLEKSFSQLVKVARYLYKHRRKQSPFMGLYRTQNSPEGYKQRDLYLRDAYYALAACKAIWESAKTLGKQEELIRYETLEKELTQAILRAIKETAEQQRTETRLVVSPTRVVESDVVTVLDSVYPLGIEKPEEGRVTRTLNWLEKRHITQGILLTKGQHGGQHIAHNARLAHVYRARQDQKAFDVMDWMTRAAYGTGALPETVHPATLEGAVGDGHDASATAAYIEVIREACLSETEDTLHLFPHIPTSWFSATEGDIALTQCSTPFGTVSFAFAYKQNKGTLTLTHSYTQKPKSLILSFPFVMTSIKVDGELRKVTDQQVTLQAQVNTVEIEWKKTT